MKNIFKKDNIRSKQVVASLFVLGLILMIVGISYAMYTFTGTGTKENVITTGQITVEFAEQNNILIQNRYPETDTKGLASLDSNSQMTFTVSSNIAGTATVNYAVGLTEIEEGATLTQDYIKINLTKNGSAATGFTSDAGKTIKSFENETFSDLIPSHVIARGSVTGTQTDTYTLKAWIHEDYNLPTTDTSSGKVHSNKTTSEEFSFKIKVAGTDATINEEEEPNIPNAPELATNMIPVVYSEDEDAWVKADSTNSNNSWYNYDNKVWANAVTVTETNRDTYLKATPGTPISMDDINTMWVWIPRFSVFEAKQKLIDEMAESYVIVSYMQGKVVTKEDAVKTINTAIEQDNLNEYISIHSMMLINNYLSPYVNLSDEDKASSIALLGQDKFDFAINNNFEYSIINGIENPTSTITITEEMIEKGYVGEIGTYKYLDVKDSINDFSNILFKNYQEEIQNNMLYNGATEFECSNYSYTTKETCEENGEIWMALNPGAFDVEFTDIDELAHDAFTFGNRELSGFWMGKFEISHSTLSDVSEINLLECTNDTCENAKGIQILPNKTPLRNNNVSNFYYASRSMTQSENLYGFDKSINTTIDTHMLKNNEWGAVAYLTQSIYGRCNGSTECFEVENNDASNCSSGMSTNGNKKYNISLLATMILDFTTGGCNYLSNVNQSTTGNIYGVYDMSGGADEYVMGVYTDGSKLWSGNRSNLNSGFNGCLGVDCASEIQDGLAFPNINYFNTYTTESAYISAGLQHALMETAGWYSDDDGFVLSEAPWLARGGSSSSWNGIFAFSAEAGTYNTSVGTRFALVK